MCAIPILEKWSRVVNRGTNTLRCPRWITIIRVLHTFRALRVLRNDSLLGNFLGSRRFFVPVRHIEILIMTDGLKAMASSLSANKEQGRRRLGHDSADGDDDGNTGGGGVEQEPPRRF